MENCGWNGEERTQLRTFVVAESLVQDGIKRHENRQKATMILRLSLKT